MAYYSYLSRWEHIKRRFKLLGGSYKHPNGMIELDFEEPAGIDRLLIARKCSGRSFNRVRNAQEHSVEELPVSIGGSHNRRLCHWQMAPLVTSCTLGQRGAGHERCDCIWEGLPLRHDNRCSPWRRLWPHP